MDIMIYEWKVKNKSYYEVKKRVWKTIYLEKE